MELQLQNLSASPKNDTSPGGNAANNPSAPPTGKERDDDDLSFSEKENEDDLDSDQSLAPSEGSRDLPASTNKKRGLDDTSSIPSNHSSKRAALTRSQSAQESPSNEGDVPP